MRNLTILIGLLLFTSSFIYAQDFERTEEYTFLELNTHCNKSNLSITNNAKGTTVSEEYDRRKSVLTDDEKLIIAMNDLNAKGFQLKSSTVEGDKCRKRRTFLFFKTRKNTEVRAKQTER